MFLLELRKTLQMANIDIRTPNVLFKNYFAEALGHVTVVITSTIDSSFILFFLLTRNHISLLKPFIFTKSSLTFGEIRILELVLYGYYHIQETSIFIS